MGAGGGVGLCFLLRSFWVISSVSLGLMILAEDLTYRDKAGGEFWENKFTAAIIWIGEGY